MSVVADDTLAPRRAIRFGSICPLGYRPSMGWQHADSGSTVHRAPWWRGFTSPVIRVALAMGALACRDEVESLEHRCERVRNQLVALEVPLAHPKREQHVRVMRRAMGDEFIARCTKSMTDTQRDCVLGATDSKVAFACTHTKGPRGFGRSE